MIRSALNLILVAILLLGASQANAGGCGPFAQTLYVGNTATDNQCDYDTIQAAIDAVTTCPTTIVITTQRTWSGQHLSIFDKSLTLSGGGPNCGSVIDPGVAQAGATTGTTPPSQVLLSGNDGVDDGIINISGTSHVSLRNLAIIGGCDVDYPTCWGGGVLLFGDGALILENVTVSGNSAKLGGGIAVVGVIGGAELELRANTTIYGNIAQHSGGGIYLRGYARLRMLEPQSTISFNEVRGVDENGDPLGGGGGGLFISGARAEIGSSGLLGGLAPIQGNSAVYGGGIAVEGNGVLEGLLRMFPTNPDMQPPRLVGNTAKTGGALSLADGGSACLFDANIIDNTAISGSVARVFYGSLYINTNPDNACESASLPALGAIPCPLGWSCNRLVNNDANLQYAAITVNNGAFHADRLLMSQTDADKGIDARSSSGTVSLRNCLFANNTFDSNALLMIESPLALDHCTLANNTLATVDHEIRTNADISIARSIIDEPSGKLALQVDSGNTVVDVHHVLSSDLTTLPIRTDIITGDPKFVDFAVGIYQLQADSPALDFAPGSDGKDLDFRPRKVDLNYNANDFGPDDLGAYERQLPGAVADTLFLDGFELCAFCKGRTP